MVNVWSGALLPVYCSPLRYNTIELRTQLLDFLLCRINWNPIFAGNYQYISGSKSKKTQSKSRPWVEIEREEQDEMDERWGRVDGKTFTNWKQDLLTYRGSDVYATVCKSHQNCKILLLHGSYFIVRLLKWTVCIEMCSRSSVLEINTATFHCGAE